MRCLLRWRRGRRGRSRFSLKPGCEIAEIGVRTLDLGPWTSEFGVRSSDQERRWLAERRGTSLLPAPRSPVAHCAPRRTSLMCADFEDTSLYLESAGRREVPRRSASTAVAPCARGRRTMPWTCSSFLMAVSRRLHREAAVRTEVSALRLNGGCALRAGPEDDALEEQLISNGGVAAAPPRICR